MHGIRQQSQGAVVSESWFAEGRLNELLRDAGMLKK